MATITHLPQAELMARQLDAFNKIRLTPALPDDPSLAEPARRALLEMESQFLDAERAAVRRVALRAPTDADAFLSWFEELEQNGPGQNDPLFPWLKTQASLGEMKWFLRQEIAGETGFDDLVALTQVKLPARAKLELARNYWDELGQGHASGMHGPMLGRLADALQIGQGGAPVVWESLALANLMAALATNRRYAYHSLGALGAIELTAPGRAQQVNEGLKRLHVEGEARRYFALHATLDVKHAEAWNREVLHPLVAANSRLAVAFAEGALMRLCAGARCFARYRSELGVSTAARAA